MTRYEFGATARQGISEPPPLKVWLHDEERCGFLISLPEPHLTAAREMMSLAAVGGSTPIRCDFHGQPPCPYYEP